MNGKYKYVTIASLLSAAVLLGTGCTMTEQKQMTRLNTEYCKCKQGCKDQSQTAAWKIRTSYSRASTLIK
ncbi:hypothetical protein PO124_03765 [Bacillus licheniformis]|nr:hypothetical protein [Bacillus licheniformis]